MLAVQSQAAAVAVPAFPEALLYMYGSPMVAQIQAFRPLSLRQCAAHALEGVHLDAGHLLSGLSKALALGQEIQRALQIQLHILLCQRRVDRASSGIIAGCDGAKRSAQ
jgi:hypothetical protein